MFDLSTHANESTSPRVNRRLPIRVIVTDFGLARNHAINNQALAIANTSGIVDVAKTLLIADGIAVGTPAWH
jgi:hypothetical protein